MENQWASKEFSTISFGDSRLDDRFKFLAQQLMANPLDSINKACFKWSDTKAAYRLFNNPKITEEKILNAHREESIKRIKGSKRVLALQDTTFLNYKNHNAKDGLGLIKSNKDSKVLGLLAHNTLITDVNGLPLGLFDQKIYSRKSSELKTWQRDIQKKEGMRWLESVDKVKKYMPENVQSIVVADRESDFFEFIHHMHSLKQDYVIRVNHNRFIDKRVKRWTDEKNKYLFDELKKEKIKGTVQTRIYDSTLKKTRDVSLDIRYRALINLAPHSIHLSHKGIPEVKHYVVQIKERRKKKNTSYINWTLYTSLPVNSLDSALEVVDYYKKRWAIEVFHKIIKSGCKVEDIRLETMDRLHRCLTLYSVIAWRIHWLTYIGRIYPDKSSELILSSSEWKTLFMTINKVNTPSSSPPNIGDAITWLAQLGGYMNRKNDPPPGITVIWRGWKDLKAKSEFYEIICG